jgi:hypothetical protein
MRLVREVEYHQKKGAAPKGGADSSEEEAS